MAKFQDYIVTNEIHEMMEKIIKAFPNDYEKFNPAHIHCVLTKAKRSKKAYKLRGCKYPEDTLHSHVYTLEIFDEVWKNIKEIKKYHIINRIMMSIPEDGFDLTKDDYAKIIKHDYELYEKELKYTKAANWMEEDSNLPDLFASSNVDLRKGDEEEEEIEENVTPVADETQGSQCPL